MGELKVGDRVRDNDPRMRGRVETVLEFVQVSSWVREQFSRREVQCPGVLIGDPRKLSGRNRVRLDRIHTDGKPRRSGWSLVTPDPPAVAVGAEEG